MRLIKIIALLFLLITFSFNAISQSNDSLVYKTEVRGSLSFTNNGFSFIPAFTLDKPAALAYLTVDRGRFSFNADIRYALEGRPWAVAFISRYKLLNTPKKQVSLGLYFPTISFIQTPMFIGRKSTEILEAQQAISPELTAGFPLTKKFTLGGNYLYNKGIGNTFIKNGHYLALWSNLTKVELHNNFQLGINSQIFYLRANDQGGSYVSCQIKLAKKDFPITLSSMMFKTISSNLGGKDANWNLSLNYNFSFQ